MYLKRGIVVIVDSAKLYENKVVTNPAVHSCGNQSKWDLTTPGAHPFKLREHSNTGWFGLVHASVLNLGVE